MSTTNTPPPLTQSVGEQIRKARKEANLSQEQLAKATGLHRENISRLESEAYNPTLRSLQAVCDALKINLNIFHK